MSCSNAKLLLKSHELIFPAKFFGQSHASTLLRLPDGDYLAAWFAGTREGHQDVAIYGARRHNGSWGAPERWARAEDCPHWNPVLHRNPDGEILLFFKTGKACDIWSTWLSRSSDDGHTWQPALPLVQGDIGGRGPVKNKAIVLSDGAILAPASTELNARWRCFVDRSEDGGHTWKSSPVVEFDPAEISGKGAIQPTLWEAKPGHVHMLARSSCGFIVRSDSNDGGRTWTAMRKTSLPNNNSGIDLVRDDAGRLLLICNPVSNDFGPRYPISALLSPDNGETWEKLLDLDTDPCEFSYPAIILTPDGFAGTYTWKRESICFWEATLS